MLKASDPDAKYLDVILSAIRVCADYKPKFGQGHALALDDFRRLYQSDEFYSWFGLDSPLMYAAHKAAGGMTSVYRQIGIGCQYALNQILRDQLTLSKSDAAWSYTVKVTGAKDRKLTLDGRIPVSNIPDEGKRKGVQDWLSAASKKIGLPSDTITSLQGAVFEIRQGYKSKDAKRQNADVANATNAYIYHYVPVVLLLSAQIDGDLVERYERARWLILKGVTSGDSVTSAYTFYREVLGYDLAGFFKRNSRVLRITIEDVLKKLLTPDT